MTDEELLQVIKQAKLDGVTELNLSSKALTALPPEIGQLTQLTKLHLQNNQLTALSPEIGQLTILRELYLGNNKLTALPPEIGGLAQLEELDLYNNQLDMLPSAISQLTQLKRLFAAENRLAALLPEISQLTLLSGIHLGHNVLTALPKEINQLTQLTELDLRDNPLPIPPEILSKTLEPATIINYYLDLRSGRRPLNEAKMLIVGQGSVGKTSLIRRLVDGSYDPHENKTEGIDIKPWSISVNNQEIQLNVWDFGGQEIMHATHQFFLTKRSVYLLVLDARLGEEENRVEYWLKIIQSFGENSPVIIVGNKLDQQPLDLGCRSLQDKYPNIKGFVETSCADGRGIEELKTILKAEVGQLNHLHDQVPRTWFAVKTELEAMRERRQDFLPYRDYTVLCQNESIEDAQSQRTLLSFLHDLGVVLNFQDDRRLEDTNILNPEWVTNGVYRILNNNELMTEYKGVLELNRLNQILNTQEYPRNMHLFIMDMMRKFELCFVMEGSQEQKYLVPDLLSKEEPFTGDWRDTLAFQYHYSVLPSSIISRFIVRMNHLVFLNTYWRNGVVLERDGNKALIKANKGERKISIQIDGPEQTRRTFLAVIRNQFDSIHKTIPGIVADEKVPLLGHPEIVVDYKHLIELEKLGEASFIPEGLKQRISVNQLLDGLESEAERRDRQEVIRAEGQMASAEPRRELEPVESAPLPVPNRVGMASVGWFSLAGFAIPFSLVAFVSQKVTGIALESAIGGGVLVAIIAIASQLVRDGHLGKKDYLKVVDGVLRKTPSLHGASPKTSSKRKLENMQKALPKSDDD